MNIVSEFSQKIQEYYHEEVNNEIAFNNAEPMRFGKNNHVWAYAKEWEYKDKTYQSINFGSWKNGDNNTIKSWGKDQELDKNFIKNYKKKTQEAAAVQELNKKKKHAECAKKWSITMAGCEPCENHTYLSYKKVKSYGGLRIDSNGVLLLPVYSQTKFVGVQRIINSPDGFEKRFSSGIQISGSFLPLRKLQKTDELIYISEGYATAATIQELIPGVPSVVCFSANNIPKVIQSLRHLFPDVKICIAADNDEAGLKYARQAKKRFKGVTVRLPLFEIKSETLTDFNDMAIQGKGEQIKKLLEINPSEFIEIQALGYNEKDYFYTSSQNKQMVSLKAQDHNKIGLRRLVAQTDWWAKHYGVESEDGESIKILWDEAGADLIGKCHAHGIFDPKKVRGLGVWKDRKDYVINDGQEVINKKEGSSFFYQKSVRVNYDLEHFKNSDEMVELLDTFDKVNYKSKSDVFYISSFIIQSYIFSVLDWRFHLWITGSAGTGKSTVLKWVNSLSMKSLLTDNATEAGIRQTIKSDAMTVVFDESEATSQRTGGIVELARQMSSNGEFETVRGTVSGNSINYNTQCIFCFGSIQIPILNQADRTRIFTVELGTTENQTSSEYADIEEKMNYFIDNKNKIFTYAFENIDVVKYNISFCKKELKSLRIDSRLADQLSGAMACFYLYHSNEKIDKDNFDFILKKYELLDSDYAESNSEKEHDSCYDILLGTVLDYKNQYTISEAIEVLKNGEVGFAEHERLLGVHGLIYKEKDNTLFIQSKNELMRKKMEAYPDFVRILKRDERLFVKEKVRRQIKQLGYVSGIIIQLK